MQPSSIPGIRRLLAGLTLGVPLAVAFVLAPTPASAQQMAGRALGVDTTGFDRSVRPQDDFNRFVNGTWIDRTEIPADQSAYGSFNALRDRSEQAIHDIVEEAAGAHAAQGTNLQKVGDFYASFMDSARIEERGLAPLQDAMDEIASLRSTDQLPTFFARMQRLGVRGPLGVFVGQDQKNSDAYIVSVSQSGLGLPDRSYYLNDDDKMAQLRDAYVEYLTRILTLADQPDAAGAAQRIMALETRIAEIQWDRAKNRDRNATYNKMSVADLDGRMPSYSWSAFLETAGMGQARQVVVRQPDYVEGLDDILASTPVSTWKEYLTAKLISSYADELPAAFVQARFDFYGRTLSGLQEQRPRWKRGVSEVQGALGEAVGKLYVERNFKPEAKARMDELVQNLLAAFDAGIDDLEWMSPETKAQAHEKLSKFTVKIGYPDEWRDYSALDVHRDDLLGNAMRSVAFQYDDMVDRLGEPVDRGRWGMTPQTVNAYYNSVNNEIVFPAAILQPPFFNVEADDAVNYGGIGAVIGHEISHGFDDQGRKSDGDGNLRDWWTPADAQAFEARTDALGAQFAAYEPLDGMHINPQLTMGENIGDLSGLAVAYRAYHMSLDGKEPPVIDGFTGDQRFYMGWAQVWRTKMRDEAMRQQLLTNPHSPGNYRAFAPLTNLAPFYRAWDVKPGDGMYRPPEERVKIW
jgi:predicted metalloendopeptidase